MYSSIHRGAAFDRRLRAFIEENYPIQPTALTPAARGYYGETWRVESPQGRFFPKLDCSPHRGVYERSFPVIEHLCNHGIDFISRIVKTRDGKLHASFEGGVLGLFDWIAGENREDDSTEPILYNLLAKIYAVPARELDIPREDFSARAADVFFDQWARVEDGAILALLEGERARIEFNARLLRYFSEICAGDNAGFVITHGDAGGNVLFDGDTARIVDWDDPRLTPPERDAWFCMSKPPLMEAFHRALRQNGIAYTLRPERLAYYYYHMWMFYLTEILGEYFTLGNRDGAVSAYLSDYLEGWMNDNSAFARGIHDETH